MELSNMKSDYLLYEVDSFIENCSPDYRLAVPDALLGTTLRNEFNNFSIRCSEYEKPPLDRWIYSPRILQPKVIEPDTSRIDKSELCRMTQLACGLVDQNNKKNMSITSMILKRQAGQGLTRGQQSRITDSRKRYERVDYIKYDGKVSCGSHSPDGEYFLAATGDRNLRLYRTVNAKLDVVMTIPVYVKTLSIVLDTAFSPDGNTLVYCGWSDSLHVCATNGNPRDQDALKLQPEDDRNFCISSVAFSNNGNEVIASSNDGNLYVCDFVRQQRTLGVRAYSSNANAVRFADNASQVLITGGENGICKVWDLRTLGSGKLKPVGMFAGHRNGITYIDPRGDGRHLITNSKDQTIKLWDMRAFSNMRGMENTLPPVGRSSFKCRREWIRSRRLRETILLDRDTSIMTYRGHSVLNTLMRCRFSPAATTGQQYIYTGSGDGSVIVYDVLTGNKVSHIERCNKTCVRDVSWHPYQPHLVSSSWDGSIETWTPAPLW